MSRKFPLLAVLTVGALLGVALTVGAIEIFGLMPSPSRFATASGLAPEAAARLADVLRRVRADYVQPLGDDQLVDSAIDGIFKKLDGHSQYLDPTHYRTARIDAAGRYSGIGLDISVAQGRITVLAVSPGSPAASVGIRAGDVVVAVDHHAVDGQNLDAAVAGMRGAPGTRVAIAVARGEAVAPLHFVVRRDQIRVRTVIGRYLGQGFGYVRLNGFSSTTAADLGRAAGRQMQAAGGQLSGFVLDLRGNPGGVLKAAVDVADLFLSRGLIVRGEGRVPQAGFAAYASPGGLLERVPVVVLVDHGSASASEILAGALQDHHRARLVGVRTYGKGTIQTLSPLAHGQAIKLTTAFYLTPSGRSINGEGLLPDVVVPRSRQGKRNGAGADDQLVAALDLLGFVPATSVLASLQMRTEY